MQSELENKERIRVKAHTLFMQYGIRSISMDDIAYQLGISKKTIYQSYTDKDELVKAVVEAEIISNEACCVASCSSSADAIQEMFQVMEMVDEMLRNMNPAVLFDLQKYHADAFQVFERHKNGFVFNMVKENLLRGMEEGVYREDLQVELMAQLRVELIMMIFQLPFKTKIKLTPIEIERHLLEHYLYGVASPKGYKLIQKYKQAIQIKKARNEEI
jgi:AcrR family transcriptional regulator